jgi:hypothetical protein
MRFMRTRKIPKLKNFSIHGQQKTKQLDYNLFVGWGLPCPSTKETVV